MAIQPGQAPTIPASVPIATGVYLPVEIVVALPTQANLVAANDPTGRNAFIENVIPNISLLTGRISISNANVTGTETVFTQQISVGDYLYIYNTEATPILVGKVQQISGDGALTLTQPYAIAVSGAFYGTENTTTPNEQSYLVRMGAIVGASPNTVIIPSALDLLNTQTGYNNTVRSSIQQYSATGVPLDVISPTDVPTVITPIIPWQTYIASDGQPAYFRDDLPNYVYFIYNPYGETGETLSANTMYRMLFNSVIQGVQITNWVRANGSTGMQGAGYIKTNTTTII